GEFLTQVDDASRHRERAQLREVGILGRARGDHVDLFGGERLGCARRCSEESGQRAADGAGTQATTKDFHHALGIARPRRRQLGWPEDERKWQPYGGIRRNSLALSSARDAAGTNGHENETFHGSCLSWADWLRRAVAAAAAAFRYGFRQGADLLAAKRQHGFANPFSGALHLPAPRTRNDGEGIGRRSPGADSRQSGARGHGEPRERPRTERLR